MNPQTPSPLSAFTLIELLVVVSIIAILSAFSMPAIQGAITTSKSSACLSNLRQIGLATLAYASDNNHQFPAAGTGGSPEWALAIARYASDPKQKKSIFVCPDCDIPVQDAGSNEVAVTYGMHGGLMPKGGQPLRLHMVPQPQTVILAADMCQDPGNKGWSPYSIENPPGFKGGGRAGNAGLDLEAPISTATDADKGSSPWIRYRHSGRANVVTCDGSAQSVAKGKILNKNAAITQ
jgi:prepilin-type N-terminal cleavage/methylation domain-containing protein/prepilin-type processing-associated H-X9-DG protein